MSHLPTIQKALTPVQKQIAKLEVISEKSLIIATEYLSRINQYLDTLTEEKETLTNPLTRELKEIRAKYKPAEEAVTLAKTVLNAKILQYTKKLNEQFQAEKEAYLNPPTTNKSSLDNSTRSTTKLTVVPTSASSTSGSISFIDQEDFEVMDITMLPHEYILPNDVLIRKAMKEGIRLPGIRYFTKQIIRNNR